MKKILVPVDFSDTSRDALQYAIDLFKNIALEITILHIYGSHSTALMMKSIDGILLKDAKSQMDSLINELNEKAPEVVFKTKILKSYAVSTISEMGNSGVYDMIIMGTKGASGLKEVTIGSVASGVISKTKAPVLVVPTDYTLESFKNIILAVGDTTLSNNTVLDPLLDLLKIYKSKLEVLSFSNNDLDFTVLKPHLDEVNPEYTVKPKTGELNQQLNEHVKIKSADLLCLIRTKKGFLDRLFNGSVTSRQTFNSATPLLILHN